MNRVSAIGWKWEWQVLAPTGDPIPGAAAGSRNAAIASLFPEGKLWPYALMNGYRVIAAQVEEE